MILEIDIILLLIGYSQIKDKVFLAISTFSFSGEWIYHFHKGSLLLKNEPKSDDGKFLLFLSEIVKAWDKKITCKKFIHPVEVKGPVENRKTSVLVCY